VGDIRRARRSELISIEIEYNDTVLTRIIHEEREVAVRRGRRSVVLGGVGDAVNEV
jgi:hypothetical protein